MVLIFGRQEPFKREKPLVKRLIRVKKDVKGRITGGKGLIPLQGLP